MNIPISRGEIDFAEELAKSMNMKTIDKEIIPPGAADLTPYASKIKNGDRTGFMRGHRGESRLRHSKRFENSGGKGKYIAWGHLPAEDDLRRLKDDNLYVFTTNAFFSIIWTFTIKLERQPPCKNRYTHIRI